ncbi:MAG: hypothetical protein ACK47N_16525 [Microcystis sp.]|uniref:hypothetical protein n=1 Tax=Microcystis sp. TaxID=1127 RepID=UPI00391B752E
MRYSTDLVSGVGRQYSGVRRLFLFVFPSPCSLPPTSLSPHLPPSPPSPHSPRLFKQDLV